jgi:hypothetical protein
LLEAIPTAGGRGGSVGVGLAWSLQCGRLGPGTAYLGHFGLYFGGKYHTIATFHFFTCKPELIAQSFGGESLRDNNKERNL